MKPHFKPLSNSLQTAWRKAIILHFTFSILNSAIASVPLSWQVTPRNPAPVAFDRHHGETLEFRCTFTGFGELPFAQAADIRLWYQTNGMAAAWWSVPASVSSNILSATFPPSADPGADRLALFFGAPSNAYASAVLRLRHSPGFTPNVLPAPESGYTETDPVFFAWLATNDIYTAVETDAAISNMVAAETAGLAAKSNTVVSRRLAPGGGIGVFQYVTNHYPVVYSNEVLVIMSSANKYLPAEVDERGGRVVGDGVLFSNYLEAAQLYLLDGWGMLRVFWTQSNAEQTLPEYLDEREGSLTRPHHRSPAADKRDAGCSRPCGVRCA